jgi:glycosyltransferase involved in cell wall biosynthesis
MIEKPLISVVVPVWNESKYLPPCIASLSRQTYSNFEIIAIDNKSTDQTVKMCSKAGWMVYQQVQKGISAARAEGFAKAKGSIIASTNGDTAVPDNWLETIAQTFTDPAVVSTYGPVHFIEGDTQPFYKFMNLLSQAFFTFSHLIGRDHAIGENFAVSRTAYTQIGGFNLKLPTAEDVDLNYRIAKVGKIVFNPKLLAHTSNRRLAEEKLHFFAHHIENYIRLTFFNSASSDFKPIR